MPINSTADHQQKIVYTICSGIMTLYDIEHYQTTVWMEPSIYGYNELYDFSDSDYSNIDFSDLLSIAQRASKLYMLDPDSKFAFLTHNKQHQDVADFYIAAKSLSSEVSRQIKSFSSRQEAMAWLSLTAKTKS